MTTEQRTNQTTVINTINDDIDNLTTTVNNINIFASYSEL